MVTVETALVQTDIVKPMHQHVTAGGTRNCEADLQHA